MVLIYVDFVFVVICVRYVDILRMDSFGLVF